MYLRKTASEVTTVEGVAGIGRASDRRDNGCASGNPLLLGDEPRYPFRLVG